MKIQIINGPNLNLLGKRETSIYGNQSFEEFLDILKKRFPYIEIHYYQSNVEGEIINKLHEVGFSFDGIIINAGAYTHTSVAIHDAVGGIKTPLWKSTSQMFMDAKNTGIKADYLKMRWHAHWIWNGGVCDGVELSGGK
jgi:hypothetical protein